MANAAKPESRYTNDDLAAVAPGARTWGTWNFATLARRSNTPFYQS